MENKELREEIANQYPDALLFDNPSFDNSIIGVSTTGKVVYSLDRMVDEFMKDEGCDSMDAMDFISYNTIRSLDYEQDGPIVVDGGFISDYIHSK